MTTDADGRILYVNRFGETILGRPPAGLRGALVGEVFGSPLLRPGRAADARGEPRARAARDLLPAPVGPAARARRLGDAARDAGAAAPRLPGGVPGPHRDPPAGGGGPHQGEAGRRRGDGGAARPRDPQPARLDPRLGPGADPPSRRSARSRDGCSRSSRASRSASRTRSTASCTRPGRPCARATRWTCCPVVESAVTLLRNGSEVGPDHDRDVRGRRGAPRVPRRPGPDHAGVLEPGHGTGSRRCRPAGASTSRCGASSATWC